MNSQYRVPFHKPTELGIEVLSLTRSVIEKDTDFIGESELAIAKIVRVHPSLVRLTPSCTIALQIAYTTIGIQPGDEVIMPAWTFSSTASSLMNLGGVPVLADVGLNMNINPLSISKLINKKTKAVVSVLYGGVPCQVREINKVCREYGIFHIEDAAQALGSNYEGGATRVGASADFSCFSFHYTKNIQCGEGGAIINRVMSLQDEFLVACDMGTDSYRVRTGEVEMYGCVGRGTSGLISRYAAAFLLPQLKEFFKITEDFRSSWDYYRGQIPGELQFYSSAAAYGNGHIFFIISNKMQEIKNRLSNERFQASQHYLPLWFGESHETPLPTMNKRWGNLLRLPMYYGINHGDIQRICQIVKDVHEC